MKLAWEEPFGPILPVIRVADANEALEIANESNSVFNLSVLQMTLRRHLKSLKTWLVPFILIIKHNVIQIISFLGVKGSGAGAEELT